MNTITDGFKNYYNTELRPIVNKAVKNALGVDADLTADEHGRLEDGLSDVDKKMRGNKILRQLFKSARLYGTVYEYDGYEATILLNVGYTHNDGGSNGHSMLTIWIDKNKKVKIRK